MQIPARSLRFCPGHTQKDLVFVFRGKPVGVAVTPIHIIMVLTFLLLLDYSQICLNETAAQACQGRRVFEVSLRKQEAE